MAFGVKLLIWGDYALFTRPEMKVERVSYEIMTPSAARGVLEAIYWKPEIRWIVDRIHVLNPIRFTHIRRNELSTTIPVRGATGVEAAMSTGRGSLGIQVEDWRQQRAGMILRDVRYGIEAHFEIKESPTAQDRPENSPGKHFEIFRRRAERGQCFHHPYLGTREFPAHFEWSDSLPACHQELRGEQNIGRMLLDIDFVPDHKGRIVEANKGGRLEAQPRFFVAVMQDGIIDVPPMTASEVGT